MAFTFSTSVQNMFSKRLLIPVWRQLSTHRRDMRLVIHPQMLASQQSMVSTTTTISDFKHVDKVRETSRSFHVQNTNENLGNGDVSSIKTRIMTAGLDELKTMASISKSLYEVSLILSRLNQLHKEDKFDIQTLSSSKKLKSLVELLHERAVYMPPKLLFSCLDSLLDMSKSDTFLIQSLEEQTLWLLQKLPVSDIVNVVHLHRDHQETPLRKQIYRNAMMKLNKRWVEISNPNDLLSLMYLDRGSDEDFFSKLAERALDLADSMQPRHLCKILTVLSVKQKRNVPLIRALVYHLNKSELTLEFSHLQKLLFACSSLSIYDMNLLKKITYDLRVKLTSVESPMIVCGLLTSLSLLRWRHPELLDQLFAFVENNPNKLTTKEKAGVIMSVANLNYVNQQSKELVRTILSGDLTSLKTEAPHLWLDMVWSLAVLNMINSDMAASVLDPNFVKKLQVGNDYRIQSTNLKLVNIKTAAELEIPNYAGPLFTSDSEWTPSDAEMVRKSGRTLAEATVTALTSIAPKERFVKTDVITDSGYFIDAELYVNDVGEPMPYKESVSIPECHRVCVRVLGYMDMTLSSVVPTGLHVMSKRHLSALGYKVIQIAYSDLVDQTSVVRKAQYVQSRIQEVVTKATSKGS